MVNIEYISGQGTFKFNGETRVRNYHSQVSGDKVRIVNAYDTDDWLLQYTLYTDISLNGTVYASAFELAEVLAPVLFQKAGGTDGGTTSVSGNIITKTIPVEVDWTSNSTQQIVDFVNGQTFSVLGTQRILFKAVRIIGDISTSNAAEFHFWEFKPGKGTYGVGGTAITSADLEYISFVTNYQNNVINLGEIGTTPIEVYINDNGPYGINTAALNVFKSTREGIAVNYIYVGTATSIGLGATQTTSSDYIDVNATPVNPPSSTGGLDVPQEYGLIPMSLADGSIVWVPIPTGGGATTSPTELISITTNWQQGTLDYKPYAEWRDNGIIKSFSGDRTADPADPTNARYDLWYIDLTTETVEIKKGTASANPERPSVDDPVNHLDTGIFIHILAGANTPEGVNGEVVYAENAPGEYAITAPGAVNVASTDTPHSGSVNIEIIDGQFLNQSQSIVFTPPAPLLPEGKELAYWIKNKTGGVHHWTFVGPSVKNGRTTSVVVASPGNYDPNSTAWQAQSIPLPTDLTEITSFRLVADFTGFSFHLDDITIISGGGVVVIGGDYADKRLSNIASDLSEAEKTAIKNKLGVVEGGGSSYTPPADYADVPAMLADQANQVENEEYTVKNASGWSTITHSGWATFKKKATSAGSEDDYDLREQQDFDNGGSGSSAPNVTFVYLAESNTAQENTDGINAAIQAAIPTNGTVIIRETPVTLDFWPCRTITWDNRVNLQGSGTWLGTRLGSTNAEPLIQMTRNSLVGAWGNISNLYLDGEDIGTIGLDLTANIYFNYEKIAIKNFTQYGMKTVSHILGTFTQLRIRNCPIGWYSREKNSIEYGDIDITPSTGYMASNAIQLRDCYFNNCSTFAIDKDKGAGINLWGCDLEGNGTQNNANTGIIKWTNISPSSEGVALVMNGCWMEINKGTLFQLSATSQTKVSIQDTICQFDPTGTKYFNLTNITLKVANSAFDADKVFANLVNSNILIDNTEIGPVYSDASSTHKETAYNVVTFDPSNPISLAYAMETSTGSVTDSNGNIDGVLLGTVNRGINGQVGQCFQFINGKINLGHNPLLSLYDGTTLRDFAFEFWVNFDTVGDTWFFHKRIGTDEKEYQLSYFGGELRIQIWNDDNSEFKWSKAISFNTGQWYNIKGYSDLSNSGFNILIDDAAQTGAITGTITTPKLTTQSFEIANSWHDAGTPSSFPLKGKLDEFKFYVKNLPAWAV